MSRRKIYTKTKSTAQQSPEDTVCVSTLYPFIIPETGEIAILDAPWCMDRRDAAYMSLYTDAHAFLPQMSFMELLTEHDDMYQDCISQLERAIHTPSLESVELLRAVVILGHVPIAPSLSALSAFAASDHCLAPIANLALAECAALNLALEHPRIRRAS